MQLREVLGVPKFLNRNATKFPTNSPEDNAALWTNHHVTAVPGRFTSRSVQMYQ